MPKAHRVDRGKATPSAAKAAEVRAGDAHDDEALTGDPVDLDLVCPIAQEVFTDPVRAADGRVYERASIEAWLQSSDRSPVTRRKLRTNDLEPCDETRQRVARWRRSAAQGGERALRATVNAPLFAALDETGLHAMLRQLELRQPSLVCLGVESAGKSTLLERIAGCPVLPRDNTTCTRIVIRVQLRREAVSSAAVWTEAFDGSDAAVRRATKLPVTFDAIPAAVTALMAEEVKAAGGSYATERVLCVEIQHANAPCLDLVDLPGLVAHGPGQAATLALAERTIEALKEHACFLWVQEAATRPNTSHVASLMTKHDLKSKTFGVLTKADLLHTEDDEDSAVALLVSRLEARVAQGGVKLAPHGWYATALRPNKKKEAAARSVAGRFSVAAENEDGFAATLKAAAESDGVSAAGRRLLEARFGIERVLQGVQAFYEGFVGTTWVAAIQARLREEARSRLAEHVGLGVPFVATESMRAHLDAIAAAREQLLVVSNDDDNDDDDDDDAEAEEENEEKEEEEEEDEATEEDDDDDEEENTESDNDADEDDSGERVGKQERHNTKAGAADCVERALSACDTDAVVAAAKDAVVAAMRRRGDWLGVGWDLDLEDAVEAVRDRATLRDDNYADDAEDDDAYVAGLSTVTKCTQAYHAAGEAVIAQLQRLTSSVKVSLNRVISSGGSFVRRLELDDTVEALHWSRDAEEFAIICRSTNKDVEFFTTDIDGRTVCEGHWMQCAPTVVPLVSRAEDEVSAVTANGQTVTIEPTDQSLWSECFTVKDTSGNALRRKTAITCVALSPNESCIVVGCSDGTIRAHERRNEEDDADDEEDDDSDENDDGDDEWSCADYDFGATRITNIVFGVDGERIYVAAGTLLVAFDFPDLDFIGDIDTFSAAIVSMAADPNGKSICVGLGNGSIEFVDVNDGSLEVLESDSITEAHSAAVTALAYSPSSDYLASGCRSGSLKVWDTGSVCTSATQIGESAVKAISFVMQEEADDFVVAAVERALLVSKLEQTHPPATEQAVKITRYSALIDSIVSHVHDAVQRRMDEFLRATGPALISSPPYSVPFVADDTQCTLLRRDEVETCKAVGDGVVTGDLGNCLLRRWLQDVLGPAVRDVKESEPPLSGNVAESVEVATRREQLLKEAAERCAAIAVFDAIAHKGDAADNK